MSVVSTPLGRDNAFLFHNAKRFMGRKLQYRAVLLVKYGTEPFAVTCKQWYTLHRMRQKLLEIQLLVECITVLTNRSIPKCKVRILLTGGGQYILNPLSFTLQLLAALSANYIPNGEKSFSTEKRGNIYSFSNHNGVKFDFLLPNEITFFLFFLYQTSIRF